MLNHKATIVIMEDVRWLSTREQRVWRRFLFATSKLSEALERQMQRDAGMPHAYYEVLVMLSEAPRRALRMSELAELCRSSRSRLSHAVAKMEQVGWVRRRECPSDKRGAFAELTEEGYAALAAAAPGHVATVRQIVFDPLTPEQVDQLHEICIALTDPTTKSE